MSNARRPHRSPPFPPRSLAPLALAILVAASSASPSAAADRPRVGLALSGGGARGAAHIGVLKVLEEHRIPVDLVAGTSMGALVGGLYASGLTPAQLDSVVSHTDWSRAFADFIPRADRSFRRKRDDDLYLVKHKPGFRAGRFRFPPGILDGHRVDLLLKRLTLPVVSVRDFDDLGIPFHAVAADLVSGAEVVLDHGDLALALRASMAIPAAFAPREIGGLVLVDGGIVNNFPIGVARAMGADVVIAVDIATPAPTREELASVPAITAHLATLASEKDKQQQISTLAEGDVLIRPALGSITVASFERCPEAVEVGERAARAALPALERLALSPEEYAAHRAARAARTAAVPPPVVAALRVVNRSRVADAVIARRIEAPAGRTVDPARLETDLDQVYGLELFESVYYDLAPGPAGDTLKVTARERSWGPDYLQGGVVAFEDFEHPNFNLALAYSRTAVNRLNGEWRTGVQVGQEPTAWTELHQPLDAGLRTFVHVGLQAGDRALNVFDRDGRKRAELGIRGSGGTIAAGREIGTWGELRAGVVREGGLVRVLVADPGFPVGRFDTGELFGQVFLDRLDDVAFPRRGSSLRARLAAGLDALGSTADYAQLDVEGCVAASRGHGSVVLGGEWGTTLRGVAPLERCFGLGGLGRLSGLEQDERLGQHDLLLRAQLQWRIVDFTFLPVYAGLTGEYGDVFESRRAIGLADGTAGGSVFMAADTFFGPLCLALGLAEGGRTNYYMTLGQPLGTRRPGFRFR